ncbi:molybdopterin-dependent oxidoreductase [Chloroflexota bacterium]
MSIAKEKDSKITKTSTESEEKIIKTACHLCHGGCIVLAHVKNGKLIKVEGAPDGIHNQGAVCDRCNAVIQYIYSPYRLKYPMKRVGERGEGKWQRISWDEAFDTIASKLMEVKEKYGGHAIAYTLGTGRVNKEIPIQTFFSGVVETPNGAGIGHLCLSKTRSPVMALAIGKVPGRAGEGVSRDWERAECIVSWGCTLLDSRSDGMAQNNRRITNALDRGAKLIVVDPVYTRLAQKAHIWLPIRPGTDTALALAWQKIIINEGLYDKEFVEKWTNAPFLWRIDTKKLLKASDIVADGNPNNFVVWDTATDAIQIWNTDSVSYEKPEVKVALTGTFSVTLANGEKVECRPIWQLMIDNAKEWTLEKTSEVTWLSPDKIRESAIMYATTKPASMYWGVAMSQQTRCLSTNLSIYQLWAITGNFDIPGGQPFYFVPGFRKSSHPVPPKEEAFRIGKEFPFSNPELTWMPSAHQPLVWKALASGEIKVLFANDSNPLVNHENAGKYILEALKKAEFIVWPDITMTPSNEYADILLPVTTPYERNYCSGLIPEGITIGRAVIEPVGESKSDFDIFHELSKRMGREDLWPWKTEEEYCEWQLAETGTTYKELSETTCFLPATDIMKKYEKGLLRQDKKPGFPTISGKVELYLTMLEQYEQAALPVFKYPLQSYETTPELAKDYPLVLITGSRELNYPYFHTQYHYIPWLRQIQPFPVALINPKTAKEQGIKTGNWVWIENKVGRARYKVQVTERIHPKVVSASHAWWYPELPGPDHGAWESNANLLIDPFAGSDPITGSSELRGILCKIYKADGPPPGVKDDDYK